MTRLDAAVKIAQRLTADARMNVALGVTPAPATSTPFAPLVHADPKMKALEAICGALGVAITVGSAAILKAFESAGDDAKAEVAGALRIHPGANAGALLSALTQFLLVTDALPEIVKQQASVIRSKCIALGLDESETNACIASKVEPRDFLAMKGRASR